MFGQGRMSFESPNVVDNGDLPPSRPSRQQRALYSDEVGAMTEDPSCNSNKNYSDHTNTKMGDDNLRTPFKPPLRGSRNSRTIKLDLLNGFEEKDQKDENKAAFDSELGAMIEFKDEEIDDSVVGMGGPCSPTMDTARVFAMTMLAETERRRSDRSLMSDDASIRSAGGSSMRWPRRGRRQEFPGLRGTPIVPDVNVMIHTREGLLKAQVKQRQLWCIRLLILLVGIGLTLCFAIFAGKARRSETINPTSFVAGDAMERLNQVKDVLVDNDVSSLENLKDPASPQYKALSWIVLDDKEQVDVTSTQFIQRYTLAVLYFAWSGPEWNRPLNFLSNQHECGWFDAIKDENGEAMAIGVTCDVRLQVRSLNLASNNLGGQIPKEIQYLTNLEYVDMNVNSLKGTIPASFAMLSNLEYINLNFNELTGAIPAFLGDFSQLAVLGLSQNQLTGELPASLGSLPLKTLAIDDNLLEGNMAAVASMTGLQYLYAGSNNFEAPLDQGLLADLAHLIELDLSGNAFYAQAIPRYLFLHPRLRVLDLHDNRIHGTIPLLIPDNNVMEFFSLRGNFVSSSIPSQIENLRSLTHLDLESNSLTGTIPADALATMTSLSYLFLGKNPMRRAPIPDEFQALTSLKELSLDSLHLTGRIPLWLETFAELRLLDLRSNSLTGKVPMDFSNLQQLRFLLLNQNLFTGDIPTGLGDLSELKVVSLHHNGFYGEASLLCNSKSQIELLTTDCESIKCKCCQKCCDGESCFEDVLWDTLENGQADWEENFARSDYGFSSQILYSRA